MVFMIDLIKYPKPVIAQNEFPISLHILLDVSEVFGSSSLYLDQQGVEFQSALPPEYANTKLPMPDPIIASYFLHF